MFQSIFYFLSIALSITYTLFFMINLRPIWQRDQYYFLLYCQLCLCSLLVLLGSYIDFTFINLFILFLVFSIYPHSSYTFIALGFDLFLFFQVILIILRRQEYDEILSKPTKRKSNTDDYPPAIDMTRQSYQNVYV